MKNYKDYYGSHGMQYEKPQYIQWSTIEILQQFYGQKYNQDVFNCCYAFNPTLLRVVKFSEKLDFVLGRISIHVDSNNIITKIYQEVQIGCDSYEDGEKKENKN